MEHHQNGFEHDYVLQNIPNHILIRDVVPRIHALISRIYGYVKVFLKILEILRKMGISSPCRFTLPFISSITNKIYC